MLIQNIIPRGIAVAVSVVTSPIILVRLLSKYPLCGYLFDFLHLDWVILKQTPIKSKLTTTSFSSYISWIAVCQ